MLLDNEIDIHEIFTKLWRTLRKYPGAMTPFLIMGFLDLVLLAALYYASKPPVSPNFTPYIRSLWGEKYLHYPANFLILPELFGYGKNMLMFVTGLLSSGVTIAVIFQILSNTEPDWKICISKTFNKYFAMFFIWALVMTANSIMVKFLGSFYIVFHSPKHIFIAEFFAGTVAQTIFVYSIPAIIIENKKILASIKRTLFLVKEYPLISLAIILLPNMLLAPMYYLHFKMTYFMSALFPEITLWMLVMKVIMTTAIDFVITVSAALMLLMHREFENKNIVL